MRFHQLHARAGVGLGVLLLAAAAGVAPASAAQRSAVTSTTYTWGSLHRGDCQQDGGRLVLRSDGTADFSAVTLTYQTHSHDVWWSTFKFYSPAGTLLFTSPTLRSPDMVDGNPPPTYAMTGHFTFDPVYYTATAKITQASSC